MRFRNAIKQTFWNQKQERLRALWRLILHTILLVIFVNVFFIVLFLVGGIFGPLIGFDLQESINGVQPLQMVESPWLGTIIIPGATVLAVFSATYLSGKWIDKRKITEFGITTSKDWWRDFIFGLALGAFLMGLIFIFGWLTGNIRVMGFFQSSWSEISFLNGFVQSLFFFVCVGFYEELLSRSYHLINLAEGLHVSFLDKKAALVLAIILSSIVFGLLHANNPHATWISTLNISLAGIFLGLGMYLTGSLAIPIGLHITWNFFQGNVFGFPVSGISSGATIIATEAVGPQWLTGGLFGPEAGVLGLAAMVLGSILTLLWVKRQGALSLSTDLAEYDITRQDIITPSN